MKKYRRYYSLSKWNVFGEWNRCIIVFFIVVHPYFGSTSCIASENVATSTGKTVWVTLTKNVANARAGNDFESASAHPNTK